MRNGVFAVTVGLFFIDRAQNRSGGDCKNVPYKVYFTVLDI